MNGHWIYPQISQISADLFLPRRRKGREEENGKIKKTGWRQCWRRCQHRENWVNGLGWHKGWH